MQIGARRCAARVLAVGGEARFHLVLETFERLLEQGVKESLLVDEVILQRALGYAGALRDGFERDGLHAVIGGDIGRGLQQLRTHLRRGFLATRAGSGGLGSGDCGLRRGL
ncbi:hypothetical protein PT2222_70191 [Paraburkholderia tropica]